MKYESSDSCPAVSGEGPDPTASGEALHQDADAGKPGGSRRQERSRLLVRRASPADAEIVAALARALTQQQGDPGVSFTADAVLRDGFGSGPKFDAWLAETAGGVVGYALVVPAAYETSCAKAGAYVQDLFVSPEARRSGIGRALLAAIAADARARGLEFIWWVSRTWNTDAHEFFRRLATVEEPVVAFATFGEDFTRLAADGESTASSALQMRTLTDS